MRRVCFKKYVIHFRRWSRKAYAIFASLSRQVRICRLRVDMCQGEFLKSGRTLLETFDDTRLKEHIGANQDPPLPEEMLLALLPIEQTNTRTAPSAHGNDFIYLTQKLANTLIR